MLKAHPTTHHFPNHFQPPIPIPVTLIREVTLLTGRGRKELRWVFFFSGIPFVTASQGDFQSQSSSSLLSVGSLQVKEQTPGPHILQLLLDSQQTVHPSGLLPSGRCQPGLLPGCRHKGWLAPVSAVGIRTGSKPCTTYNGRLHFCVMGLVWVFFGF